MKQLKIFTAEELSCLHLSIVREIGSVVGVRSSTSLSKEELIDTIIKIQNKEIEPTVPTGKGAPKKIKIDLYIGRQKKGHTDKGDSAR